MSIEISLSQELCILDYVPPNKLLNQAATFTVEEFF